MKIEIKNKSIKPFEDIKQGEVFVLMGETIPYIKTEELKTDDDIIVNAISLNSGNAIFMNYDDAVVEADATLTIGRI